MKRAWMSLLLVSPLVFSLRLERLWDSQEIKTRWGSHNEFNSDFVGTVAAAYPVADNLSVIGRAGYRLQDEQPQYGVGLEYKFYVGR